MAGYAFVWSKDGNWPDEMNTTLVGPLFPNGQDDERVREVFDPGTLILEPMSFEDYYRHLREMEEEVDA